MYLMRLLYFSFFAELEWLNTKEALTFKSHLKGKVVVLDFFTYCCINCMHILPDLHALEEELSVEDGLVVIGVHSAKFENEKTSQNILNAILRYDITHPVVNDYLNAMWEDLDITCWPTLMIVGPSGEQIVSLVGEGNKDAMFSVCRTAVEFYKSHNQLSQHSLPIKLYKDNLPPSVLSFPGKIAAAPSGNKLAISDSGHHRILITTCNGVVLSCIGGKEPGWKDGLFEEARFHSPQGICWSKEMDKLFVADTENHAIRVVSHAVSECSYGFHFGGLFCGIGPLAPEACTVSLQNYFFVQCQRYFRCSGDGVCIILFSNFNEPVVLE